MVGNKSNPKRREVLKSVPGVAGFGAIGVAAGDSRETTRFAEVAVSHKTESLPQNPSRVNVGQPQYHQVDQDSGILILNEAPLSETKSDYLTSKDKLVWCGGYRSPPTRALTDTPRRFITTAITENYRQSEALQLVNKYRPPKLDIEWPDHSISISSKNESEIVSVGETTHVSLPSRRVVFEDEDSTGKRPVKVTPEIHVANHGKLRIVNP